MARIAIAWKLIPFGRGLGATLQQFCLKLGIPFFFWVLMWIIHMSGSYHFTSQACWNRCNLLYSITLSKQQEGLWAQQVESAGCGLQPLAKWRQRYPALCIQTWGVMVFANHSRGACLGPNNTDCIACFVLSEAQHNKNFQHLKTMLRPPCEKGAMLMLAPQHKLPLPMRGRSSLIPASTLCSIGELQSRPHAALVSYIAHTHDVQKRFLEDSGIVPIHKSNS